MRLIHSAAQFKLLYPYKSPPNPEPCPKPSEYPKRYPCACEVVSKGGGLGGDYEEVEIYYPPKGCHVPSWFRGLNTRKE